MPGSCSHPHPLSDILPAVRPNTRPAFPIERSKTPPNMILHRPTLAFALCLPLFATAQIPTLLRNINATGGSDVQDITCVEGLVYFSADDGVSGNEVWVSDGTPEGTRLLKDINPGAGDSGPLNFLAWQDRVYFVADNGVDGYQLWSSDGTTAGTQFELPMQDVQGLVSSSRFTVYNDLVVFRGGTDELGSELWRSDGTVEGTTLIMDINPGTLSSNPHQFTEYNGLLYFSATVPGLEEELWVTDGTAEGTHLVKDIDEGTGSGAPRDLAVVNGLLYFKGDDGYAHDAELWVTDGTTEGTYMVKDIVPGGNGSLPQDLLAFNGELWFVAYTASVAHLWHSDGTEAGTVMLELPEELLSTPDHLVAHGGSLYFSAYINGSDQQLFRTDGTVSGTVQLVQPGSTVNGPLYPTNVITSCGDFIFYAAKYDEAIGTEPYTILSPVGLEEAHTDRNASLYPNPATDRLFLADAPSNAKLRLFVADGRLALERPVQDMDIATLPSGLYLARIVAQDGTVLHVQPVVKE